MDLRDPGLQPERTTLAWRRTLISLVVVDLFIWRRWLSGLAGAHPGFDYQGLCALVAAAATVVLASVVWVRSRELHHDNRAAHNQAAHTHAAHTQAAHTPAASRRLVLSSTLAVMALGGAVIAAIASGG
ncbi:DUF202 domain-containing protein [Arthrobacter sp. fls2-241-R2A-200]|uniref:DUF202 domain-containing protein n=1 Tax=Arthrobacter sp. fls2-241-R2A-200 TaxID=3040281 RepID=UPI00254CA15F|nr:DUF202 domain-containing protein [Arthrobacter sp. fls2-241-R2A-200]